MQKVARTAETSTKVAGGVAFFRSPACRVSTDPRSCSFFRLILGFRSSASSAHKFTEKWRDRYLLGYVMHKKINRLEHILFQVTIRIQM